MIAKDGKVETSPRGSVSFPYGAAAMTRKLEELSLSPTPSSHSASDYFRQHSGSGGSGSGRPPSVSPLSPKDQPLAPRAALEESMREQFRQAYEDLELPESLRHKAKHGGLTLYLSGGGFRGWGYLLMSQHRVSPYPIPIINGFQVGKREFQQTAEISAVAAAECVFRISKRRAAQVPAVAFLVNVLVDALPAIQHVRFCQGGVREGFLYDTLDTATKALDPLAAATAQFGTPSAAELGRLLYSGLPPDNPRLDRSLPATFTPSLVRAVADMMYMQLTMPKESRSLAALHAPLTGVLASAHGVSHADRAVLGLALCARWNVDLPPPHGQLHARLGALLTHQEVFWAEYLGTLAGLVGAVYPAGRIVDTAHPRLRLAARWADGLGKKGLNQGVVLDITCRREDYLTGPLALNPHVNEIEKLGKKKNRVGGEHGFGVPIEANIDRVLN
jgi:retrograde regulation protein 2